MIRRLFRLVVLTGVAAAAVAAYRALTRSDDPLPAPATTPSAPWPPLQADPAPAASATRTATVPTTSEVTDTTVADVPVAPAHAADDPWADPTADGECPDGFPIKAKLSSKIFHAPGQLNYDRTTPDRCYRDETAAVADGLRAAKR